MENTFQTSFIPKKNAIQGANGKQPPKSILTIIAALVLLITIGGCVGLFVYKKTLNRKKGELSASLATIKNSLQKESVDELTLYSDRVKLAQQILDNHVVLSPLFALLSTITLPEVQFTKFDHSTTPAGFEVKMSGVTTSYRSLALQADVFSGPLAKPLSNVVFSNIGKAGNKKITFELKFLVNKALLSYTNNEKEELNNMNSLAPKQIPSSPVPPTFTLPPTTPTPLPPNPLP